MPPRKQLLKHGGGSRERVEARHQELDPAELYPLDFEAARLPRHRLRAGSPPLRPPGTSREGCRPPRDPASELQGEA